MSIDMRSPSSVAKSVVDSVVGVDTVVDDVSGTGPTGEGLCLPNGGGTA